MDSKGKTENVVPFKIDSISKLHIFKRKYLNCFVFFGVTDWIDAIKIILLLKTYSKFKRLIMIPLKTNGVVSLKRHVEKISFKSFNLILLVTFLLSEVFMLDILLIS